MARIRTRLVASLIALSAPLMLVGCSHTPGGGATQAELRADTTQALDRLVSNNAGARAVSERARSVLVFPSIVKGGLVFGGAYGEGAHLRGGGIVNYYNSFSASWGLQAGAQTYGYALFLMNEEAERYLDQSDGWEIGVGPTVVVVDAGIAESLSTSTLNDDAYAFIFDQKGLMAGVSIEGTKVSRVKAK